MQVDHGRCASTFHLPGDKGTTVQNGTQDFTSRTSAGRIDARGACQQLQDLKQFATLFQTWSCSRHGSCSTRRAPAPADVGREDLSRAGRRVSATATFPATRATTKAATKTPAASMSDETRPR